MPLTETKPKRSDEDFCRCGHFEDEHTEGRCQATEPDRCTCYGFRYGARSKKG